MNPYVVLGVAADALPADIQKAYRRLVRRHHPDRQGGDRGANDRLVEVNAAYALLKDAAQRSAWDTAARAQRHAQASPAPFEAAGARWSQWSAQAQAWWTKPPPRRVSTLPMGDTATVALDLPLSTVAQGSTHTIQANIAHTCPLCAGRTPRCAHCGGTGQRVARHRWKIAVPPGTPDGTRLALRGVGHDGPRFSAPGDVHVVIRWTRTGIWHWHEGRLEGRVAVSARKALQGGRVALRTPRGGSGWLTLPPDLNDGDWLRVPELGFDAQGRAAPVWIEVRVRKGWLSQN